MFHALPQQGQAGCGCMDFNNFGPVRGVTHSSLQLAPPIRLCSCPAFRLSICVKRVEKQLDHPGVSMFCPADRPICVSCCCPFQWPGDIAVLAHPEPVPASKPTEHASACQGLTARQLPLCHRLSRLPLESVMCNPLLGVTEVSGKRMHYHPASLLLDAQGLPAFLPS